MSLVISEFVHPEHTAFQHAGNTSCDCTFLEIGKAFLGAERAEYALHFNLRHLAREFPAFYYVIDHIGDLLGLAFGHLGGWGMLKCCTITDDVDITVSGHLVILVELDPAAGTEVDGQVPDDFHRLYTCSPDAHVDIVGIIVVVYSVRFYLDDVRVRYDFDIIFIEPSFDVGTEAGRVHRQDTFTAVE